MKRVTIALAGAALLFGACTGDPNKGGIFWSKSKADQRLADMSLIQFSKEEELGAAEKAEQTSKRKLTSVQNEYNANKAKLESMRSQLKALRSPQAQPAATGESHAAYEARIKELEADIARLEKRNRIIIKGS